MNASPPSPAAVVSARQAVHLNPIVRVRFDEGIRLDLPLQSRSFTVSSPAVLAALSVIGGSSTVSDIMAALIERGVARDEEEGRDLVAELVAAGVLAEGERPSMWAAAQHWVDRGWLEALLFHTACSTDSYVDEGVADADALHDIRLRDRVAGSLPSVWTRYEGRPAIALPAGRREEELPRLEQVLLSRRSNQPWKKGTVPLEDIATILRLASRETVAVRRRFEQEVGERPSALLHSAFTALELYVVIHETDGAGPGLYHYEPDTGQLRLLRSGDHRAQLQKMCVGQQRAATAGAVFVVSAVWDRYMRRYPQPSAYRTLMINVGELSQKLVLLATATGLSTFITPAFDDQYADELFRFDPDAEGAIEAVGVG
jgi:SagB-type dehydrogenase family enzyme